MLEALGRLGLSEAQITYLTTKLTQGKNIYMEELPDGRYYRHHVVKNAPQPGLSLCTTFYYDMLIRYRFDINTVETVIDLIQEVGFQTTLDDRLAKYD